MTLKKLFLFCIIFLFPFCAYAQADNELSHYLSQLHSMQAHFSQTIRDARGHTLDQTEGEMALLRPGKFRWETAQPQNQLVIADGENVLIYDKDLDQVTRQKQQKEEHLSPALLLSSNNQTLLNDFVISEIQKNHFSLVPRKNSDALFNRLILEFNQNKLSDMKMIDKLGQITLIHFSNIKLNNALSANYFHFTIPKGVDVVDNR